MKSIEKKSKRFKSLLKDLDQSKSYKIEEAVKLIKDRSKTKFVESIDLSLNLNIEKTKSDQTLRTTVELPHGNGKKISVAVICANDKIDEAKSSGAEKVGSEDLVESINNGKIDFDSPSKASFSVEYENVDILSVPSRTFKLYPLLVISLPSSKSSKILSLTDSCPPIEK